MFDVKKLFNYKGIIYTNNEIKKRIIKYFSEKKKFMPFSFVSREELKNAVLGYYKDELLIDINDNFSINEMYFNNSLLLDDVYDEADELLYTLYKSDKIQKLLNLRKNIVKEYSNILKQKEILFINYYYDDDIINKIINKLEGNNIAVDKYYIDYDVLNNNKYDKLTIRSFENQKKEVISGFRNICELINKDIKLNNIYIYYNDSNYKSIIKEYSQIYKIPVNYNETYSLYEYNEVKELYKDLEINKEKLLDEYVLNEKFENSKIVKYCMNILNKFVGRKNVSTNKAYLIKDLLNYILYLFKNKRVNNELIYSDNKINMNRINIVNSINDIYSENDHLFIFGFNQNIIPNIYKDIDYLTDKEKNILKLINSETKNKYEKQKIKDLINRTKNIYISFSLETINGKLIPSSLINDMKNKFEITTVKCDDTVDKLYSINEGKYIFNKDYENYLKYNVISKNVEKLNKMYDYDKFKYEYEFEDSGKLKEKLSSGMRLSYTTLNDLFKCPYSFYLNYILKVKKLSDDSNERSLLIGNMCHNVLCEALNIYKAEKKKLNDNEIKTMMYKYYENNEVKLSNELEIFNEIFLEYLNEAYKFVIESMESSNFEIESLEKEYIIDLKDNFTLKGDIDKVLTCKIGDDEYKIIIDYKTYDADINLNRIIYGLDMQIMIYYKLLGGQKINFGGGYLSRLFDSSRFAYEKGKTYKELCHDYFKYKGYTNENKRIYTNVDTNLIDCEKTNLSGIFFTSKKEINGRCKNRFISDIQYKAFIKIVEEKLDSAIEKLKNCKFDISPVYDSKSACQYCGYKELCYKKENDVEKVQVFKNLEFLDEYVKKIKEEKENLDKENIDKTKNDKEGK